LEQVAGLPLPELYPKAVFVVRAADAPGERIVLVGNDDQMDVIRHEAVAKDLQVEARGVFG
jgi:hypothetical protein